MITHAAAEVIRQPAQPVLISTMKLIDIQWDHCMTLQRWHVAACDVLSKPGIQSRQLVSANNSPSAQVTITHVTMEPGSLSKRHVHERAEQTWIVEQGEGILLLADERTEPLRAGDIIRTPAGSVHGVENTGPKPLVYLAVTTPPQDFSYAYDRRSSINGS